MKKCFGINGILKGCPITVAVFFLVIAVSHAIVFAADVRSLVNDAGTAIRNCEKAMFSGKLDEAKTQLDAASGLVEKIRKDYPDFSGLKSLESKIQKITNDLAKRVGASPAPAQKQAADRAAKGPSSEKLPGGVTHRLKNIDKIIEKGEGILKKDSVASNEWKSKELETVIRDAQGTMDEILKGYGTQMPENNLEISSRNEKIAAFKAKVEAFNAGVAKAIEDTKEGKAKVEALSNEWLSKMKPYIAGVGQPGHDPSKYMIAGATEDLVELARRKKVFDEAESLFSEYKKVKFSEGKTEKLEMAEKELDYALKSFKSSYSSMSEGFFQKAKEKLDNSAGWLQQEAAKDDGKRPPNFLSKDIFEDIKGLIVSAESGSPNDPRIAEMKRQFGELENKDRELRELRVKRTFMKPDRFSGPELSAIKDAAVEFLKKDKPDATLLRTTVISDDWKEERVLEHTDTTKTAVRYRVTRAVTAQIAARVGGDVFLHTMYVAKDQRSDGTWGRLYGHGMYSDRMLEENVNK